MTVMDAKGRIEPNDLEIVEHYEEKGKSTLGEKAMQALRGFGEKGATAAEVAEVLRAGGFSAGRGRVGARLAKYAKRGAVKMEYSTGFGPDVRRFYARGAP